MPNNCNHTTANGNSNNNNMNSNNLNLASSHNGFVAHTHQVGGPAFSVQQNPGDPLHSHHHNHARIPSSNIGSNTSCEGGFNRPGCTVSQPIPDGSYLRRINFQWLRSRVMEPRNRPDAKPIDANALHSMDDAIDDIDEQYAHFAITRSLLRLVFGLVFKVIVAIYLGIVRIVLTSSVVDATTTTPPLSSSSLSSSTTSLSPSSASASSEQCLPNIVSMVKQKLAGLDTKYCQINGETTETLASSPAAECSMHEIAVQNKCFAMANQSAYGSDSKVSSPLSTSHVDSMASNGIAVQYCCDGDNKSISKPNGGPDIDTQIICDTNSLHQTGNGEANEKTKGKFIGMLY